tara:strand:+ start:2066 stop:3340 length:1275 start_codon:yes stop_codon:yes gene_type:complete
VNLIKKNLREFQEKGPRIFLKKISTFFFYILLSINLLLFIPILIVIYFLGIFFILRFGPSPSTRIGHFAGNFEVYLCELSKGINKPNKPFIDIFFNYEVCNKQLLKMWKKKIIFLPRLLVEPLFKLNKLSIFFSPYFKIHNINMNSLDRDIHNLYDETKPNLNFSIDEEKIGQKYLSQFGLNESSKFVTLTVRDENYFREILKISDWDRDDFRNQDINNYSLALEELTKRGYFVFRVGKHAKKFNINNSKIVDYANSNDKSDLLDIYLAAKCDFCISGQTGYDGLARVFRKPIVSIMGEPGYFQTFCENQLLLCKHHINIETKKKLNLSETLNKVAFVSRTKELLDQNIESVDNSPEEIRDVIIEMVDRIENKWKVHNNEKDLQKKFWKIFEDIIINNNKYRLHGRIKSKFSHSFLNNNQDWIQ